MSCLLLLVLAQLAWTYGVPQESRGGGAFAYSDSTGKKYSGTYGLRNGQVVHTSGDYPVPFSDAAFPGFPQPPFNDFGRFGDFGRYGDYPPYSNYEMPNFANGGVPNFGQGFPNSAFASSAVGPGYRRQVAAINPENPDSPNVNVNRFSDTSDPGQSNFYHVSSKSYSSSSNVNGKEVSRKGAETVVNDNGKVTKFKVGD